MCKDCALRRLKEGCNCFESEPITSETHELFFRLANNSIDVMDDYFSEIMFDKEYCIQPDEEEYFLEEDYYDTYQDDLLDYHEHHNGSVEK